MASLRIVVLEGDETGQELLEEAIRVLDPDRPAPRAGASRPLAGGTAPHPQRGLPSARRGDAPAGLGLKAATITPEGAVLLQLEGKDVATRWR
jgi:isocitrate dehydrogenase (NAD+)